MLTVIRAHGWSVVYTLLLKNLLFYVENEWDFYYLNPERVDLKKNLK